jgi:hypothetical protein
VSSTSSPATSNSNTFNASYTASDGGSGLDKVELYVDGPGVGGYVLAATDSTPTAGEDIAFTAGEGDGTYNFYTRAYDEAGNVEDAPVSADDSTLVDTAKPASSASSPSSSTSNNFNVSYTASDGGSGLSKVELYVNGPGAGGYALAATDSTPTAGEDIAFAAGEGDGTYDFYTRAYDTAGNVEDAPGSADDSTVVDAGKPVSSASSPSYSTSNSFNVSYTASDAGSGLTKVELYVDGPGAGGYVLAATDSTPTAGEDIAFTAGEGDGTYRFYTRAYDTAGNVEDVPGSADDSTVVDGVKPSSSADSPATSNSNSFNVAYSASDATAGLDKVELYANGPGAGGYVLAGTDSTPGTSGNVAFTAGEGNGTYQFYTVAYDKAGNTETTPAGEDDHTVVDTAKPTSAATAPATSSSTGISVGYTAGDGSGTGLNDVELWVKAPSAGSYSKVATDTTPSASGESFSYTANAGDGIYSFYTRAHDNAGNYEDAPATADATTTVTTGTAYTWTGFFSPVDNLPMLNSVKAGAAAPVKFSLGGDKGLDVFASGYPISQVIPCDSTAPVDGLETTSPANASGLQYDPATQTYTYVWKTLAAWKLNPCRQLVLKFTDGSYHRANFKFK